MTKFLKPAEGRTVHLPDGPPFNSEGMEVEESLFIRRRLADGDLIEAERPKASADPDPAADSSETQKTPKGGK